MNNRLREQLHNWRYINAHEHVLQWIDKGVKFPFKEVMQGFKLGNRRFNSTLDEIIKSKLTKLILHDQVGKCSYKPKCVSPIACVYKKKGKRRLVTDLRQFILRCAKI